MQTVEIIRCLGDSRYFECYVKRPHDKHRHFLGFFETTKAAQEYAANHLIKEISL